MQFLSDDINQVLNSIRQFLMPLRLHVSYCQFQQDRKLGTPPKMQLQDLTKINLFLTRVVGSLRMINRMVNLDFVNHMTLE